MYPPTQNKPFIIHVYIRLMAHTEHEVMFHIIQLLLYVLARQLVGVQACLLNPSGLTGNLLYHI